MTGRLRRIVDTPKWPVPQLATFELRDYASQLRDALKADLSDADRAEATELLAKVTSEQAARRRAYKHATPLEEAS